MLSYRVNKFRATFFPPSEYVTFTSYDHTYRKKQIRRDHEDSSCHPLGSPPGSGYTRDIVEDAIRTLNENRKEY